MQPMRHALYNYRHEHSLLSSTMNISRDSADKTLTRHLVISGRVQGVWFRDSMCIEAQRLGVTGWVRNRRDGTVEAMVQGEKPSIDAIIDWAHQGPPDARVADVAVGDGHGNYKAFIRQPNQ